MSWAWWPISLQKSLTSSTSTVTSKTTVYSDLSRLLSLLEIRLPLQVKYPDIFSEKRKPIYFSGLFKFSTHFSLLKQLSNDRMSCPIASSRLADSPATGGASEKIKSEGFWSAAVPRNARLPLFRRNPAPAGLAHSKRRGKDERHSPDLITSHGAGWATNRAPWWACSAFTAKSPKIPGAFFLSRGRHWLRRFFPLLIGYFRIQGTGRQVDGDHIPIFQKSQGAAHRGFGRNLADAQAPGEPGEAPIGNHRQFPFQVPSRPRLPARA